MAILKQILAKAAVVAFVAAVALPTGSVSAAANQVDVYPGNEQGWAFFQEIPNGSGAFVNGPATPPL